MRFMNEDFLKEETRNGFRIEEMMKRAWATELAVLSEIDRICTKYGISYQANYGTLLGAVRHKGFVPWDDDMDISMKRGDYQHFLRVAEKELPPPMKLQSIQTKRDHNGPICTVINREMADIGTEQDKRITEQYFGCPYVVGVDIYPLDFIPRDSEEAELQRNLYAAVYDAAQRYEELREGGELPGLLERIEELTGTTFERDDTLPHQLWLLSERIAMMYGEEESDKLIWMPDFIFQYEIDIRREKIWYDGIEILPFEMTSVPVPAGYREVLSLIYGDYMEFVQGASAHDYPFYQKQEAARQEYFRRQK